MAYATKFSHENNGGTVLAVVRRVNSSDGTLKDKALVPES